MSKTNILIISALGLALAACTSTSTTPATITFSSIITAVQGACGVELDVADQPTVAAVVAGNKTLNSVATIASYICAAANAIPATAGGARFGTGQKLVIPLVLPNGTTVTITGTR